MKTILYFCEAKSDRPTVYCPTIRSFQSQTASTQLLALFDVALSNSQVSVRKRLLVIGVIVAASRPAGGQITVAKSSWNVTATSAASSVAIQLSVRLCASCCDRFNSSLKTYTDTLPCLAMLQIPVDNKHALPRPRKSKVFFVACITLKARQVSEEFGFIDFCN